MKLSVVIVSYNVRYYLAQCIDSVMRATRDMEADIWVVDNNSSDDSVTYLSERFPQVNFISNHENVGFARANNQAIKLSHGEYVLLLNPDTIVGEDVLKSCVAFLDEHPEAGATGTMMINRNGSFAYESRRGVPTPTTAFYKICGLCKLFPYNRRFGKYYMRYLDKQATSEIDIISGAFFMVRRTALEQVGLLSEDYFMYGEDIDLSYSLLLKGWKNFYQPLPILHYKGESTQKSSFRYVHSFYNAMIIFFNRHFRKRYFMLSLVVRFAVIMIGVLEMLKQQWKTFFHKNTDDPNAELHAIFIGTYPAWKTVGDVAKRANIILERAKDIEQAIELARARTYNYIIFHVGDSGMAYSDVLRQLQTLPENGFDIHLGTFNFENPILILSDAISL